MENPLPRWAAANPAQYNIDAIAKLEHDALDRRTLTELASDIITKLVGNVGFLLAQLLLIFGWTLANLHLIPGLKAFDPFPFGVLALLVSSESVFLTIFVLISQSRMARQSERRSHLDLQVGMLSEQELTTMLQMLQKLCQHMGVNVDSSKQEVQSFSKTTDVHKLASELEDKLPEDWRGKSLFGMWPRAGMAKFPHSDNPVSRQSSRSATRALARFTKLR
jgi:uncharacterized membrane protein